MATANFYHVEILLTHQSEIDTSMTKRVRSNFLRVEAHFVQSMDEPLQELVLAERTELTFRDWHLEHQVIGLAIVGAPKIPELL